MSESQTTDPFVAALHLTEERFEAIRKVISPDPPQPTKEDILIRFIKDLSLDASVYWNERWPTPLIAMRALERRLDEGGYHVCKQ